MPRKEDTLTEKLKREFYTKDTLSIARELIGCTLVSVSGEGAAAGRIVETEAYLGKADSAAHSSRGRADGRTEVLYRQGGYAYVYLIYGMYCCFNISTGPEGVPECVLIRALEPLEGVGLMQARRGREKLTDLCSGPGKLCQAMGISREQYGADLTKDRLFILTRKPDDVPEIAATPRINIEYAAEHKSMPWRFVDKNSRYLSVKLK